MQLKQELEQRGFLKQYTHEEIFPLFEKGGQTFYFGVDPSADSMTIGNFVALMQCIHFMLRGNKCYLLVGGATGMIGNPTGKDKERNFLDEETLQRNQAWIHRDLARMCANVADLTGKKLDYEIVNNYDWFKDMGYLQFLREVGKNMTVNRMMNKDIVRSRINDPEKSISYAEFSYMLIMGYDFYVLNRDYGVTLEIGWSDEWDGILAGIEITSKLTGQQVYGLTNNLILDSTGRKFGKSEGNAIWLDPAKNSPYSVYQYFLNTTDEDVERYLKLFTLLSFDEIDAIVTQHIADPARRYGQEQLATYVVTTIFGTQAATQAAVITSVLFATDDIMAVINSLDDATQWALCDATWGVCLDTGTYRVTELAVSAGLAWSNGEAKKLIQSGALSINEKKVDDIGAVVELNDWLLVRKGKKGKVYITAQ